MSENLSKQERAKRLIRDLLAKTVENGATEAEASAAMAKASELMLQYDISLEDAQQVRDEVYGALRRFYARGSQARRSWHEAIDLAVPISKLTGTRVWREPKAGEIIYFGQKQDTEIAHYLLDLCINCCETEWKAFQRACRIVREVGIEHGDTSIRGRKAFLRGMIIRLAERIEKLASDRAAALRSYATANALVVVKNQIVEQKFDAYATERGLTLRSSGSSRRSYGTGSNNYAAGRQAGDKVSLSPGLGPSGASAGRLGRD